MVMFVYLRMDDEVFLTAIWENLKYADVVHGLI